MNVFVRESSFGRLLNSFTNGRVFPYNDLLSSNPSSDLSLGEENAFGKFVSWTGPDDPTMPMNWSTTAKLVVTFDVMILNFTFYVAAAIFTPSISGIETAFGTSSVAGTLGLSLFVIAYGIGPLILSPISNLASVGRTVVYMAGLFCFFIIQIGTARAKNVQTVLILRFLAGFIGSSPISIGGATLSEIYGPSERAYAISLYAVAGIAAPVLGPILGTLVIERWNSWTAPLWLLAGLSAFSLIWLFFSSRKHSHRLRSKTGDPLYRSQSEIDATGICLSAIIVNQVMEDFKMSFVDPTIVFVNLHTMLLYALLYLWFEFFPFVFGGIYGFTPIEQGLAFFGILVGAVISVIGYTIWLRYSYVPMTLKLGSSTRLEARLRPGQLGAFCIPICLFIFAWTSRQSIHWIFPIIGTSFFAPGFFLTFQAVLNYLGDAYPHHAASVFAGNTFFRSSIGGALPLAAPTMLNSLGIGWASSVLGFISVAMLPIPFVLEHYGERLRLRSRFAS